MRRSDTIAAAVGYLALLCSAGAVAGRLQTAVQLGPAFPWAFISFALILAPLVFFGFGAAESLRAVLRSRAARIAAAALLVSPYLLSSLAVGGFDVGVAAVFLLLPVGLAVIFEFSGDSRLGWPDVLAFAALSLPFLFHLLNSGWAQPGLPKLLLTDIALYLYLVVRPVPRVGYDFHPQLSDLALGVREWIFFAPIAIVLGLALGFLHWHPRIPHPLELLGGSAFTLVFIAVPEELFFRGLLLNLLETRLRPAPSLLISAVLFGLAHFNKGAAFNWRYVLLASLAGMFYGRAWRSRHRVLASAIAHTLVDVTWSLWFR